MLQHLQISFCRLIVPVDLIAVSIQSGQILSPWTDILWWEWCHRDTILSQYFCSDTLHDLRSYFRIYQNLKITVAVCIDESRSYYQPCCINHFHIFCCVNITYFYDLVIFHQYIGCISWFFCSVYYSAAFD